MTNGAKRMAWVTGGGSGIGEAGAQALAADGWTVVVSGRRKDALDAVVAKIAAAGGKAEAVPLDVSAAADVEKAAGCRLGPAATCRKCRARPTRRPSMRCWR